MLTFERIDNKNHPCFEDAFLLYEKSFPIFERRTKSDQIRALTDKAYHFELIKSLQGKFLGILLTWHNDDFIYVEHLAITPKVRGKNIGSRTLQYLKEASQKTLILEIDPPIDDVSINRKRFYQNAGFVDNAVTHVHPSYRNECHPHSLEIMLFPAVSAHIYDNFKQYMDAHIMQYSESSCW